MGRVRVSARGSGLRVRAPWESRDRCVGAGAERESGAGGAAPVGSPRVSAQRARVCAAMRVRTEPAPGPSGEPLPPAPAEEAAPGPPRHRPPPERLGWCWGGAGARSIPERLGGGTGREDAGCPPGGSDRSLPHCPAELQRRGAGGRRALGFALFSFSVWLPRDCFGVKLLEASGAGGSAWGAWAQPASMLSSRSGWSRRKRRVGHGTCRKKPRVRPIRASAVRVNIGGCFGGNVVLNLIPRAASWDVAPARSTAAGLRDAGGLGVCVPSAVSGWICEQGSEPRRQPSAAGRRWTLVPVPFWCCRLWNGAKRLWESQAAKACLSSCLNSQCFVTSPSLGLGI